MGRKKKETITKAKKTTTPKKEIKEVVEIPSVAIAPTEVEEEVTEEPSYTYTTTSTKTEEEILMEIECEEKEKKDEDIIDEICEEAIKETFKENNKGYTRLIDRMFGYSWNGQEIDY